jgi:hypothetical protein
LGGVGALDHPFNPTPFTQDQYFTFGTGFYQPLVGLWDPPLPGANKPISKPGVGTFADVAVKAEVDSIDAGGMAGVVARRSANGANEYWGGLVHTGNTYTAQIRKLVNGTWTTLASKPVSFKPSGMLELDVVGTSLSLSFNGTVLITAVDSSVRGAGGFGSYDSPLSHVWPATATALIRQAASWPYSNALSQGLDSSWDQWSGSFATKNGALAGQGTNNLATLYGVAQRNVVVQVDVVTASLTAGQAAGLVTRYNSSTGDMYYGEVVNRGGIYYAEIWKTYHGKATRLSQIKLASGFAKVASHHLMFETTGSLSTLFVDGKMVGNVFDGSITGLVGGAVSSTVGLIGGQGVRFQNFSAKRV